MRKVYLTLLALGTTGLLAACGTNAGMGYEVNEGKAVLTETLIAENYNQNSKLAKVSTYSYTEIELPDGYELYSTSLSTLRRGAAIVTKSGKYGVYSIFGNKMIIDARLTSEPHFMHDYYSDYEQFGTFISYQDVDNKYYIADGAGNVLFSMGEEELAKYVEHVPYSYAGATNSVINGTLTATVRYNYGDGTGEQYKYYTYDANNLATKVDNFDALTNGVEETTAAKYAFDGGSARVMGDTLVVYKEDGTEKGRVDLPQNLSFYKFFGKYFIYQHDARGSNEDLHMPYTKTVDLTAGKPAAKAYELKALIEGFKVLNNTADDKKYAAVNFNEVKSDGSLGANRTLIMDQDLKFHEDITYKDFAFWTRLANGYFVREYTADDHGHVCLYDPSYKLVFDYNNQYETCFYPEYEVFRMYQNGNYCFYNNEGKFIYRATGSYVPAARSDNDVIVFSNGKAFNTKTLTEVELEDVDTETKYVNETRFGKGNQFVARISAPVNTGLMGDKTFVIKTAGGTELASFVKYTSKDGFYSDDYCITQNFGKNPLTFYVGKINYNSKTAYGVLSNGTLAVNQIAAPAQA